MSALPDLQDNFIKEILFSDSAVLPEIKTDGKITPEQRMQIYRNNTFVILTDNLKGTFPATVALGSEEFFCYLAHEFIKKHPPLSGDMNSYGSQLPAFMRLSGLTEKHPFLADLAELEWLRQESYMAADADAFQPESLDSFITEDFRKLGFVLHPSLRLLRSGFPVIKLWKLGKGQAAIEDINLDAGENALVFRRGDGVEMWSVDRAVFDFVQALNAGQIFAEAALAGFEQDPAFSPETHFANLIVEGLIHKIKDHDDE